MIAFFASFNFSVLLIAFSDSATYVVACCTPLEFLNRRAKPEMSGSIPAPTSASYLFLARFLLVYYLHLQLILRNKRPELRPFLTETPKPLNPLLGSLATSLYESKVTSAAPTAAVTPAPVLPIQERAALFSNISRPLASLPGAAILAPPTIPFAPVETHSTTESHQLRQYNTRDFSHSLSGLVKYSARGPSQDV